MTWKEAAVACCKEISGHLPRGTGGRHEEVSVNGIRRFELDTSQTLNRGVR
jgi:hypothetical protein